MQDTSSATLSPNSETEEHICLERCLIKSVKDWTFNSKVPVPQYIPEEGMVVVLSAQPFESS
jgi:hypothetical protein